MQHQIFKHLKYIGREMRSRGIYIAFFAMVFVMFGTLVPDVYYRYFDKTQYYQVIDIELLATTYPACGKVSYLVKRVSLIDMTLKIESNLLKVEENGQLVKVHIFPTVVSGAGKGNDWIKAMRQLPCDLDEGDYIIQFFYNYNYNSIEKVFRKDTKPFIVSKEIQIVKPLTTCPK